MPTVKELSGDKLKKIHCDTCGCYLGWVMEGGKMLCPTCGKYSPETKTTADTGAGNIPEWALYLAVFLYMILWAGDYGGSKN